MEKGVIHVAMVVLTPNTAARLRGNKIGSVGFDLENHVTVTEFDSSIGVTGSIVEEMFGGVNDGLGDVVCG